MSKAHRYLEQFGFKRAGYGVDVSDVLVKKLGSDLGMRIAKEIDARAEGKPRLSHQEFYSLKNTTLESSLVVTGLFEEEHLQDSLEYLEEHQDLFRGRILDIGCDQGITACFIAMVHPDLEVLGIDLCPEAISAAQELAARLKLSNVSFRRVALKDMDEKFDTVIAMRTLSENFNTKADYDVSQSLVKKGRLYRDLMGEYAKQVAAVVNSDGYFITIDRNDWPGMSLGWMMALQECNIGVQAATCNRFTQDEVGHEVKAIAFAAQKGVARDEDALYGEYNKSFSSTIDPFAPQYEGEEAALIFQNSVRGTILCFNIYAKASGKCWAQVGAFLDDDPTSIMMYMSRYDEFGQPYIILGNYDISRREEILEEIYNTRAVYLRGHKFRSVENKIPEEDWVVNRRYFRIKPNPNDNR